MTNQLPLIINARQLEQELQNSKQNILLVDMSSAANYIQHHIKSAVFLDYSWIVRVEPPRMGLLPNEKQLDTVLNGLGLTSDTHVIAYDDEGGGRACRLLWTLETVGHQKYSLLDGGIQHWLANNLPVTDKISYPTPCETEQQNHYSIIETPVANQSFILTHIDDPQVVILDARSPAEYTGQKAFAERAGHIPKAINWDWMEAMDKNNNLCLKPQQELSTTLDNLGITKDKLVITHCQTHHRSAHTYIVLKSLGYDKIKGYPGSWSDWGNTANTPVV
ncbi:Thiosulfate sulfurtransferase, rhodanese [hydrothermal vent metagenome]|uniref:Thiosulfate sulfurtransferase, rhodanese n=1 Tax=hydrothermal vent metagenome TaxID=652676 RepID=A0A3B1AHE7_9ZZZZ